MICPSRLVSALAVAAVGGAVGCARPAVSVEVLPPRTSVTCAAPSADAAAYGQGLFDVTTTLGAHGSYLADLRVSVPGADVRVDGVRVAFSLPDASDVDAADFDGDVLTGDVVLHGEKNDLRVGVIENVELVGRDLAVALQEDGGLGIDEIEYATLALTITPIVAGDDVDAVPTTFGIELCKGCLVTPPDICSDPGEFTAIPVICRPGQDIPAFACNAAAVNP